MLFQRQLVGPTTTLAFGLAMLFFTLGIQDTGKTVYGPRFWPLLIALLLIAVNVFVIARTLLSRRAAGKGQPYLDKPELAKVWLPTLLVLTLPFAIQFFGFLIGTGLFLALFIRSLGYTKWRAIIPICITFALAVTYFFTAIAYTPLPRGIGPFHEVSVLFIRAVTAR